LALPIVVAMLIVGLMPILARPVAAQDSTPTAAAGSFPVTARFLNAMTSVGTIDISLNSDDNHLARDLKYGQVSDPVELTAPVSNIIVKEPRNLQYDLWLFNTIVSTTAGQSYVIVVSDFLIIPVEVDTSKLVGDTTRGRLVQASSQAPAIDIVVNGNTPPVVTGLAYGRATDTGTLKSGTVDITLLQSGTQNVALDAKGLAMDTGQSYVLVLIGKPGSTEQPLSLVSVATPTQTS
jgi:hypothetical protein